MEQPSREVGGALGALGALEARLGALEAEGAEKDQAIHVLGLVKAALVARVGAWGRAHAAGLSPGAHAELAAIVRDSGGGDLAPLKEPTPQDPQGPGAASPADNAVASSALERENDGLRSALEECFLLLRRTEGSLEGLVQGSEGWREASDGEMAGVESRLAELEARAADVTGALLSSIAERDGIIEGMSIELEKDVDTLHRARDVITVMEEVDQAESALMANTSAGPWGGSSRGRESADACTSCARPELRNVAVGEDTDTSLEVEVLRDKLDDTNRLMADLESQIKQCDEELVRLKLENETLRHNTEMGRVTILTTEAEKSELEGEIAHLHGVCSEVVQDTAALLFPGAPVPQTPTLSCSGDSGGEGDSSDDSGGVSRGGVSRSTARACQEKLRTSVTALQKKYSETVLERQIFSDKCEALQKALEAKSAESMGLAGEVAVLKTTMDSQAGLNDQLIRDLEDSRQSAVREVSLRLAGREREIAQLTGELQGVQEQVTTIVEYHTSGEAFVGAQKQLDSAYVEVCQLSDSLVQLETQMREATSARRRAEEEAGNAKTRLSYFSSKSRRLEDDLDTLKKNLAQAQTKSTDTEGRLKSLKGENSSLWSSLNQSRERNRTLVIRLQDGEDRSLRLSKSLEALRVEVSKSEAVAADANQECQRTQERFLAYQTEQEAATKRAQSAAEESIRRLQAELEVLQAAAARGEEARTVAEGRFKADILDLEQKILELEAVVDGLRAKNASLQFSHSSAEAERAELDREHSNNLLRIEEILNDNAALQLSVEKVRGEEVQVQNKIRAELEQAGEKIALLENFLEDLRGENAQLQERTSLAEKKQSDMEEKVHGEQAKAQLEVQGLNSQIQGHNAQVVALEVSASETAVQMAELQNRYDSLSLSASHETERQESTIEGLRAKNASLQFALSSAEADKRTALDELRGDLESLRSREDDRMASDAARSGEMATLQEEKRALVGSMAALRGEKEALEHEGRELRRRLEERETVATSQARAAQLEEENAALRSSNAEIRAEAMEMRAANLQLAADREAEVRESESRIKASVAAVEDEREQSERARLGEIVKRAVQAERDRAAADKRATQAEEALGAANERALRAEQALSSVEERAVEALGTSVATEEKAANLERQAEVVEARQAYADTLLSSSLEMTANVEGYLGEWEVQLRETVNQHCRGLEKLLEGHAQEVENSGGEMDALLGRLEALSEAVATLSVPESPADPAPSPREDLMELARTLAESNFEKTLSEVKRVLDTALGALGTEGPIPVKERWRLTAALSNLETQLRQSQKSASRIVKGFPQDHVLSRSTSWEPIRSGRRRSQTVHALP